MFHSKQARQQVIRISSINKEVSQALEGQGYEKGRGKCKLEKVGIDQSEQNLFQMLNNEINRIKREIDEVQKIKEAIKIIFQEY